MSDATAYEGVAAAWAAGPARLYDRLAAAVVDRYPDPLQGRLILDGGAGTGSAAAELQRRGARVVAVDSATDMVDHLRGEGIEAVTADLRSLPLATSSVEGAVYAFSVSHVDEPAAVLREAGRVVAAGGAVCVAVFAAAPRHGSKDAVDAVAADYGYVAPDWYVRFKQVVEPRTAAPALLQRSAEKAGLRVLDVVSFVAETGIERAEDIVAVRAGMAHLAPFVASLSPTRRRDFFSDAIAAVRRDLQPLRPEVLVLRSRAAA